MDTARTDTARMNTAQEPPRLYRFGFLVTAAPDGIRSRPNERWREERVGRLAILLHDEAELRRVATPSGSATVLGPAFAIGGADLDRVLARLVGATGAERADALSELSGRFCVIVQDAAGTRAFADPIGSRSIFYAPGDPTSLASHAGLLADHLGAARSGPAEEITRTDKFKGLSVKYLPGDMTMWEGIAALPPNMSLALGAPGGAPGAAPAVERFWPVRARRDSGFDELRARSEAFFEALARSLAGRPVVVGVTGGIDMRLLLAGLRRRGLDLRGTTWLGNYHHPRERPIIDAVVERVGLPHAFVDVSGPADETAVTAGRNSGGFRGRSRLTSAIREQGGDLDGAVFLRGHGGEVMRGFYNLLDRPLRDGSPAELARAFARKSKVKDADPAFDRIAEAAFASWAERAGYDAVARLGYDVNDVFYWEHRMGTWGAAMHNEMDAALMGMTGLNDRAMFDLAYGLPREVRLRKGLFEALIGVMEPRLAGLPTA